MHVSKGEPARDGGPVACVSEEREEMNNKKNHSKQNGRKIELFVRLCHKPHYSCAAH